MYPPLSDRYQDVRPIGTGALTTVLQAWDRQLGRAVAVKVPIGRLAGDKVFLLRLERELVALAGFTHPNVARLLAVERGGQGGVVVGELVEGGSLAGMLAARGPLPAAQAARLGATVCAALAAAHARGIVHGHLTPANVLLAVDGQVKLTDFGVARAAQPLAGAPDPGADLRALGRLLAAMLSGQPPAEGAPVRLGPAVPAALAAVVSRAVDRGAPYRSAAEVGGDLDGFLATVCPAAAKTARRPAAAAPAPTAPPTAPPTAAAPAPAPAPAPCPARSPAPRPAPAAASCRPAVLVAPAPASARRRGDANRAPAPPRRRGWLAVAAGLVGAGLLVGGGGTAVRWLDRQPDGPALGQAVAAPPAAVVATTSTSGPRPAGGPAPTSRASATTAPATTAATTIAPAGRWWPTATRGRVPGAGQRIVPEVRGLRRQQAAKVLARAQLGMQSSPVLVGDPGQVQRVVAQQPAAGQILDAGAQVTVLVGTKR
jgi:eukaryotic-like serine/threonine-protein kinase